jgi:hypothetical protein
VLSSAICSTKGLVTRDLSELDASSRRISTSNVCPKTKRNRHYPNPCSYGPLRDLSNEERAMIMLKSRDNEKFKGILNAKLKKVRKATDITVKHDQKKDNIINILFKIIAESKNPC